MLGVAKNIAKQNSNDYAIYDASMQLTNLDQHQTFVLSIHYARAL